MKSVYFCSALLEKERPDLVLIFRDTDREHNTCTNKTEVEENDDYSAENRG